MPTYGYRCNACGHIFEEFQSIIDEPLDTCPNCNEKQVKRIITGGAGFLLKGSGFYTTDYRSNTYKEAMKKEEKNIPDSIPVTSPKKDTKKKN